MSLIGVALVNGVGAGSANSESVQVPAGTNKVVVILSETEPDDGLPSPTPEPYILGDTVIIQGQIYSGGQNIGLGINGAAPSPIELFGAPIFMDVFLIDREDALTPQFLNIEQAQKAGSWHIELAFSE